jgi:lysophospholipase L1-like esterase
MNITRRFALQSSAAVIGAILTGTTLFAADDPATATAPQNTATIPVFHNGTTAKHEKINARAKQGDVDLVFIGDSITDGWQGGGKAVWEKYYGNRKAMNAGIGGDKTQHVIWRIDHGNLDGLQPKLAVIMIGTNNSGGKENTAEEIADGIKVIIEKVHEKSPETKVLLLAIFPRGDMSESKREATMAQREKNAKASEIASKLADDKTVFYMDIGKHFVNPDGSIPRLVMNDLLHPTPDGYAIWAAAIEPKVAELLGEKK